MILPQRFASLPQPCARPRLGLQRSIAARIADRPGGKRVEWDLGLGSVWTADNWGMKLHPEIRALNQNLILAFIACLDSFERYNDSCIPTPEKGLKIAIIRFGRGLIKAWRIYLIESLKEPEPQPFINKAGKIDFVPSRKVSQREESYALAARMQPQLNQPGSKRTESQSPSANSKETQ